MLLIGYYINVESSGIKAMKTILIQHTLPIQERINLLKSSQLIGTERQIKFAKTIIDKAIRKGYFGYATANVDIEIPLSAEWWIENQNDQDLRCELFSL